ncbi:MAG: hypothetical protein J1F05_00190 [Muribaculaceae bacterium]|nr:hypothetical protein [Muribaculaceae bacterium]
MKIRRSTSIPLILAIYLAVMAGIGYKGYAGGETSALQYFGVIAITVLILILLHFSLKRREKLRQERTDDIENSTKSNN